MANQRVQGKVIMAGYDWSVRLVFDEAANFPEEAAFVAHVRVKPGSEDLLATMSTADGTITRVDERTIDLELPGTASASWPEARRVFIDMIRIDETPALHMGFRLGVPVYTPVTRL